MQSLLPFLFTLPWGQTWKITSLGWTTRSPWCGLCRGNGITEVEIPQRHAEGNFSQVSLHRAQVPSTGDIPFWEPGMWDLCAGSNLHGDTGTLGSSPSSPLGSFIFPGNQDVRDLPGSVPSPDAVGNALCTNTGAWKVGGVWKSWT